MFNPDIFAVNVGRAVELLRASTPNKDQQKACLRAVYALTSLASATMRLYDDVLSVDDVVLPSDLPFSAGLRSRLETHAISEIAIARGTSATELLTLLRALAADPGAEGVAQRLDAAGVASIAVLGARESAWTTARTPSVTRAFELAAIEEAAAAAAAPTPLPQPPPAPPEVPTVADPVGTTAPARTPELAVPESAPPQSPGPAVRESAPPASPEKLAAPHGVPADTPLGWTLDVLLRDPYGDGVLDRLSDLGQEVGVTIRSGQVGLAVQAMAAVIGLEPAAQEGPARASYGIVLRRMLTRDALERVARLLPDPRFSPVATAVLQRGGTDAADLLVDLLTASEIPRERKSYLGALRVIPHGTDAVLRVLGHHQWVAVKNVVDLLGEMRVEEAVPALGRLLTHREPRVQRAAAMALARIGSVATVEPLRRAFRDGPPEMRGLIAASIGGSHSRALAMPLVAAAEMEENGDVQAEYYRALGRIGSPEAIDALVEAAKPGGRIFGRRPTAPRIAAVDGLRNAGGPVARRALEALADDLDKAVREAAQRALAVTPARTTAVQDG